MRLVDRNRLSSDLLQYFHDFTAVQNQDNQFCATVASHYTSGKQVLAYNLKYKSTSYSHTHSLARTLFT